jgi:putative glutamine amidotransferase
MTNRPRIAVMLDENTSGDATRYEASKNYFRGISDAGGLPFGVPYLPEIVSTVVEDFDGLLSVGGRFAFPDDWYIGGSTSKAPPSERFAIEQSIMQRYLVLDKPVLGICAGMQMLACLDGCRMSPDVQVTTSDALEHDKRGFLHPVSIVAGTRLAGIIRAAALNVNSFHREAIIEVSSSIIVSAFASDGIVEAIEMPSKRFAIGLQWHQEAFAATDHLGNRVFKSFVEACWRTA